MKTQVSIYDLEIKVIRKALKTLAPTLSVKKGRGTGYGWIGIRGSGKYGEFTEAEKKALETLGLRYGSNYTNISPDDTRFYVEKAAKLLGIELPEPIKEDYERRDEYKRELERKAEERRKRYESCDHEWVKVPGVIVFPSGNLYKCEKCGLEETRL